MKTRIIWTKIWEDDWFQSLSNDGQKLFLFLISNQKVNMTGCYQISNWTIGSQTRITDLEKSKVELSPKVLFYKDWVYVVNAKFYGGYSGPKNDTALCNEYNNLPEDVKSALFKGNIHRVSVPNDSVSIENGLSSDTSINHKSEIINPNKGIVKGEKKYSSLKDLTDDVIKEVADEYEVSVSYAKKKVIDIGLWCKANGKVKKDYKATLQTWIRGDLETGKVRRVPKTQQTTIDPPTLLTPEQIEKNSKITQEIREKLPFLAKPVIGSTSQQ